ncbi:helix-turn-helix domain-containing protein [Paeniglutamicibacter psychrophenolicus]|uniref:DNA-binding transcriptional regulator YiaG n=1 Tax=Paeniglutamicibacter psychrophenolicus TaxID=257454 RepID=A0ABS4WD01_9MICC|nr:helix-turn-helix transcriptional regulator [Paeniglutamicibacter psychrophenolicus]MBP2374086.1 DNA-binding transcriptional regulator YiaG [Paeniglutamicibacter psychrophenolicus]
MTMMTTTTPPLTTQKVSVPFVLAFGAALAVSSALSPTAPVSDWTVLWVNNASIGMPDQAMETSTGQSTTTQPVASSLTPAENISKLRVLSGLTADQVGRLLGVSRRSVQNWVAGNAMAAQHEEHVSRLLSVVQALPGSTAEERRSALLDSSNGESLFHKLLAQRAEASRVQGRPLSVGERISL